MHDAKDCYCSLCLPITCKSGPSREERLGALVEALLEENKRFSDALKELALIEGRPKNRYAPELDSVLYHNWVSEVAKAALRLK